MILYSSSLETQICAGGENGKGSCEVINPNDLFGIVQFFFRETVEVH